MSKTPLRSLASLAVLAFFLLASGQRARAQANEDEYRVKAAFIFHFAQLVDWPPDTGKSGSLFLCTLGEDPFGGALEEHGLGQENRQSSHSHSSP
jgi:hypothetical protein